MQDEFSVPLPPLQGQQQQQQQQNMYNNMSGAPFTSYGIPNQQQNQQMIAPPPPMQQFQNTSFQQHHQQLLNFQPQQQQLQQPIQPIQMNQNAQMQQQKPIQQQQNNMFNNIKIVGPIRGQSQMQQQQQQMNTQFQSSSSNYNDFDDLEKKVDEMQDEEQESETFDNFSETKFEMPPLQESQGYYNEGNIDITYHPQYASAVYNDGKKIASLKLMNASMTEHGMDIAQGHYPYAYRGRQYGWGKPFLFHNRWFRRPYFLYRHRPIWGQAYPYYYK